MKKLTDEQIEAIRNGGKAYSDRLFKNIYERATAKLIANGVIKGDKRRTDDTNNKSNGRL